MRDLVGYSRGFDCSYGISAAYDRNGSRIFCHGLGNLKGAFSEGRQFEDSHGAVPDDGAGARDFLGEGFNGFGPDIERHHVGGNGFAGTDDFRQGAGFDAVGDDVVGGQQELEFTAFRLLQKVAGKFDLVFFEQTLANGLALCLEEGISHASSNDEGVNFAEQVLDDSDFVADLGATEDGNEGRLGVVQDAAQILQLFFHEQARGGFLHKLGDADCRSMGTVRSTEGVVDVELGEFGELL